MVLAQTTRTCVRASFEGDRHAVAWAYDRPGGGRGFGFTGAHHHHNYRDDNFRKAVLNGIAWVAGLEVPPGGVVRQRLPGERSLPIKTTKSRRLGSRKPASKCRGVRIPSTAPPPIAVDAEQPFDLEVAIPPNRYRHIYFVFESDSLIPRQRALKRPLSLAECAIPRRAGQRSSSPRRNARSLHRARRPPRAARSLGRAGQSDGDPGAVPASLSGPPGRHSFHARVSFHLEGAQKREGKRQESSPRVFRAPGRTPLSSALAAMAEI